MYWVYTESFGFYKSEVIPDISPDLNKVTTTPPYYAEDYYIKRIFHWYVSAPYADRVHKPNNEILVNWRMLFDLNDLPKDLKMKALLLNIPL